MNILNIHASDEEKDDVELDFIDEEIRGPKAINASTEENSDAHADTVDTRSGHSTSKLPPKRSSLIESTKKSSRKESPGKVSPSIGSPTKRTHSKMF